MRRGKSLALMALAALFLAPLWGCGSNRSSEGGVTTAQTSEEILRATSFVGADRCGGCHSDIHDDWSETAHTQKLRDGSLEVNYTNDSDTSGRSDFFDAGGLDLNFAGSAFESLGANAPILGKDAGGAFIQIATNKYYVKFTLGGSADQSLTAGDANVDGLILNEEAQWKQRYITQIGKSNYILPVQFNQETGKYSTYDLSKWFTGTTPREPVKNDSYERRCAGCHVTGLTVDLDGDEWTMSFTDISVACEACHGPGGQHATNPTKDNIVNPETMTTALDLNDDGTVDQVDNLLVRNYVCYPCHSRGAGKHTEGGTTLSYSSRTGTGGEPLLYLPGLDWNDYYTISTTSNDYWGGDPTSGEFITSKSHHQQQQDHAFGPHAADEDEDHECFVCHDLHSGDKEHLVAAELERDGITVDNTLAGTGNNNLCLTCHSGGTDHFIPDSFQSLTTTDLNAGSANVDDALNDHVVEHAYMTKSVGTFTTTDFDCDDCHYPQTAKSAVETTYATGVQVGDQTIDLTVGDVSSHTLNIIWPNYVMQSGTFSWTGFKKWFEETESFTDPGGGAAAFSTVGPIPNSCMNISCHRPGTEVDIVTQWFGSGHADGFGEPFNHWNADGEVSASCVKCHNQEGFIQFSKSETLTAQSNVYPKVLGCETCHAQEGGGATRYELNDDGSAVTSGPLYNVVFPSGASKTLGNSSNVCMVCHQGRASGVTVADNIAEGTFSFTNRHYLAAAAIMFGSEVDAGFEYEGQSYRGATPWDAQMVAEGLNTCTGCHLRQGTAYHGFEADITKCDDCHLGITDFDQLGFPFAAPNVDYDGDGAREGFKDEIDGMEALLLTQIQAYATNTIGTSIAYKAGSYPYFFIDTNGNGVVDDDETTRYSAYDAKLAPAAYNYHSSLDPCSPIHNYKYVLQTIYDSTDDLDNGTIDASVQGTSVAATRP